MGFLMAQEGEPIIFTWIGQANTPRLRARYWLQFALFNGITSLIVALMIPGLLFYIPAGILAYLAIQQFDEGDEEGCKGKTTISKLLNIVGTIVAVLSAFGAVAGIYLLL